MCDIVYCLDHPTSEDARQHLCTLTQLPLVNMAVTHKDCETDEIARPATANSFTADQCYIRHQEDRTKTNTYVFFAKLAFSSSKVK